MTDQQPVEENSVKSYGYAEDVKGNDSCPTCERNGQFLPARIAVALKNDLVTPVSSDLIAELPTLPDGLMYILRRLNEGFIYCYSSAWRFNHYNDTEIRAYQINDLGYLTAIDKDNMPLANKDENYSCFQSKLSSKGRSISGAFFLDLLVFQSNSTKISIAYSKHQWSVETCNQMAEDASLRQRSMIEFDLLAGGKHLKSAESCYDLLENEVYEKDELDQIIPWEEALFARIQKAPFEKAQYFEEGEYVLLRVPEKDKATGKTKVDSQGAVVWVPNTEEEYKLHATDRVIVLQDPVGICEDLLNAIDHLAQKVRTAEEERLYQSAMNVIKLQSWMKAKIHAEEYYTLRSNYALSQAAQRMTQSSEFKDFMQHAQFGSSRNNDQIEHDYHAATQKMNRLTREELENFHDFRIEDVERLTRTIDQEFDREWTRSTGFFRTSASLAESVKEQDMVQWLNQQHQKIEQYTDNTLTPILDSYLAWLRSDVLLNYMESFFDHETPYSAACFLNIGSRIIGNADTMEKCSEYFAELLNETDYNNRKNYFLRLLTFDSKKVQQDLLVVTSDFLNTSQAPTFGYAFTQLFDENTLKTVGVLNSQSTDVIKKIKANVEILSEQIGSTMARVFHGKVNQNPNSLKTISMKSFETFSGKVLTRIEVSGKLSGVIDDILRRSNIDFDVAASRQQAKNAKNAVRVNVYKGLLESFNSDADLKRIQNMRTKVHLVSLIDFDQMSTIHGGMSPTQINQVFAEGVIRPPSTFPSAIGQVEEAIKLEPIHQQRTSLWSRTQLGATFGVFSFSLQSIALMQAGRGAAGDGLYSRAGVTFVGLIVSAFGGVADVLDRNLQQRIGVLGKTAKLDFAQRFTHGTAKVTLYLGAAILASVEVYRAIGAYQKGQKIIGHLYVGNSIFILLSTHAFVRGSAIWALGLRASYWGVILVIGMLLISYGISSAERSALREFLENSAWGVKPLGWTQKIEGQKLKNVYDEDAE